MSKQLINRTERLSTIERMLFRAASGLRVVEIAEACDVDRRTVYRDLTLLKNIGLPIFQRDGRYYLNQEYYVATLRLNPHELIALYIGLRGLEYYVEHQNPHVISVLKKIANALPEPVGTHVEYMIETIRGNPVDRAFVTVLDTVTRAWAEQRKVKLWYRAGDRVSVTIRDFAIYFLEPAANGGLFAVGFDYLTNRVGSVQLQRIKRVDLLNETYDVPSYFDRKRYLTSGWGMAHGHLQEKTVDIVLAFAPEVAPEIKEKLKHTGQGMRMTADHRCVVNIQVSDLKELLPWIRSWGPKVEVLEPRALRDAMADEAAKLMVLYGNSSLAAT